VKKLLQMPTCAALVLLMGVSANTLGVLDHLAPLANPTSDSAIPTVASGSTRAVLSLVCLRSQLKVFHIWYGLVPAGRITAGILFPFRPWNLAPG
jgi:hypothetical protein